MSEVFELRYEFSQASTAGSATFVIKLHPKTLLTLAAPPSPAPEWTKLEFQKCPNCPLKAESCPAALSLTDVVSHFADIFSFTRVSARVTVPERTYEQKDVAVQQALSSLLGLYMATSGCPVLAPLRPMVRFHLPFATELETIARAASMYLLEQYLVAQDGGAPDWTLSKLSESYQAVGQVNRAFAQRLRGAVVKDANVNALIRLDTFTRSVPDLIESQMDELRFLYGK